MSPIHSMNPDHLAELNAVEIKVLKQRIEAAEQQLIVAANCLMSHEAVDAFWKVWNEVGEPHKHGVYESTWMAFRAAFESNGKCQLSAVTELKAAEAKLKAIKADHKISECEGDWCGKSPLKDDLGKCFYCNVEAILDKDND